MNPIHELTEAESWELLGSHSVGRLAINLGEHPEIFPINYWSDGTSVLIRTAEGTKLFGLTVHPKLTLETDEFDEAGGWSVVLKGTAHALEHEDDIEAADASPLKPWVPTVKRVYVRIVADEITGRRFEFGADPGRDEPLGAS